MVARAEDAGLDSACARARHNESILYGEGGVGGIGEGIGEGIGREALIKMAIFFLL